jgi:NADH:ubiquinone oxidoreductase subunit 5 (subunit L)/multisubunit Na+/H+ antiporter MnhA subunit/multisubunit Na+/H+ antiporter MnhB subunit
VPTRAGSSSPGDRSPGEAPRPARGRSLEVLLLTLAANPSWLGPAVVLLPAFAGLALLAIPRLEGRAGLVGAAGSAGALLAALAALALGEEGVVTLWSWVPELQLTLSLRTNGATLGIAALIALIGTGVLWYAGAYFGPSAKGRRSAGLLALFEAAMLGLVLADNLLLLFTFWELTGLCSFFLITTDADKRDDAFASAQQALLVTVGGGLLMLVGFIYLGIAGESGSLSELVALDLPLSVQTLALALILPGILSKSAQVPLHFWLPGAMAAPTPISAFLHSATMVKAGIILLLYLYPILGESWLWTTVLVPLGALTCIWGSVRALGQDDIKLLMAWSTVSQLGLMVITLGLGTDLAIRAAALHLFAHAIFKAGLFLSVGAIDHAAHTRSLSALGGLGRKAPLLFAVTAVLCGSMVGLPPFAGFLSKELVLKKLLMGEAWMHDIAVIGMVAGSIGTVAYTLRFFIGTFLGEPRSEGARTAHAPGMALLSAPAVLAGLSLAAGLGAPLTDRLFLEPVSAALLGASLEQPTLALWHGINTPLILSLLILGLGYAFHRWLGGRHLPSGPVDLSGSHLFEGFLSGAQRLGGQVNRALAGAPPGLYFALALLLPLVLAFPLVPQLALVGESPWSTRGLVLLGLQAIALLAMVFLRGRLGPILLLTAVGFTVALIYRALHAPDLLLTQLLVEVLTTAFFVLAVRFVARSAPEPSQAGQGRSQRALGSIAKGGVALASGLLAAALAAVLLAHPPDPRLPLYYAEAGPAIAKGQNLVNVILVDFRGLDTFFETLVVLLAALGVAALLLGWEMPDRDRDDGLEETRS